MELFRALALFAEPPVEESARVAEALELGELPAEAAYTETFLFQLYPYASVYLGAEGMMGGESRDLIAGFWRALNLVPPKEADHLSVMLAFYAELCEREEKAREAFMKERWRHARKAFFREHLLSWLPVYLLKLEEIATAFYKKWCETLKAALFEELETIGGLEALPLPLRQPHNLLDPREHSSEEFLQSLITPSRSGMIIVRSDLLRAGRSLNLGLRVGERKFILKSLFNQNPQAMLDWLLEENDRWRRLHARDVARLGGISRAWIEKTERAARLLEDLKSSAEAQQDLLL